VHFLVEIVDIDKNASEVSWIMYRSPAKVASGHTWSVIGGWINKRVDGLTELVEKPAQFIK
jgi:hypothetical protein